MASAKYLKTISMMSALFFLAFPKTPPAYLDPGTGSIIIQVLIGSVVGGIVAVRMFWHQIKALFRGVFNRGGRSEGRKK